MTKSTGERIFRACVRCRQRKTKCDLQSLGEAGRPPCLKCHLDGQDCVLAGSRRGGDYTHLRGKNKHASYRSQQPIGEEHSTADVTSPITPSPQQQSREASPEPAQSVQNPLEALRILVQAATSASSTNDINASSNVSQGIADTDNPTPNSFHPSRNGNDFETSGLESYGPVAEGVLDPSMLDHLLQHYAERYHPFLPIVPERVLSPDNVRQSASEEPFLLTCILTISTKDRKELEVLHRCLWSHICRGILDVVLGVSTAAQIGSVEGLLLLAEWVPHANIGVPSSKTAGSGEDSAAWTLVGLAVRQAYLLHLDTYAFRTDIKGEPKEVTNRKRLTWTFTYMSDRQISIRMGQAFWCRGPGSSARFSVEDYPTLQPKHSYEDDHATVLLAQVELTALFGNVHDILYPTKSRTLELMLMGDYTKYLDDSLRAVAGWKDNWGRVSVSSYLKCLLDMQYEYLNLYINSFGFQAVICRAIDRSRESSHRSKIAFFPDGVIAVPDSRYIYAACETATTILNIISRRIDPVRHLRYLPVRYYLYAIHSAVFLFQAHNLGAVSNKAHQRSADLVQSFISKLEAAAAGERHIASRYRKLLSNLWFRGKSLRGQNSGKNADRVPHTPQTSNVASTAATSSESGGIIPNRLAISPEGDSYNAEGFSIDDGGGARFNDPFNFGDTGLAFPGFYTFQNFPGSDDFYNPMGADLGSLVVPASF